MSTLEEAYELTGHGKFNILALVTNGFILMYATTQCLGLGFIMNRADCDLGVSTNQRGAISASTFIGVVSPAVLWGVVADTYGRRLAMLPATVLAVVCSIMSSFAINFLSMFLLRVITGIMISASCATAYVYLGELISPPYRAAFIAWGSIFIAGAYIMMPLCAWIFLPHNYSIHVCGRMSIVSWRVLMWVYNIWGMAACIGLFILPESPAFVLSSQGAPAAQAILARIYSWNYNKPADEFPVKDLHSAHSSHPSFIETLHHMKHLIRPPLLRCVIISHICCFMVFMQSNSFYVWMPHIVDEMLQFGSMYKGQSMCAIMNDIHGEITMVMDQCVPELVDPRVYPIATVVGLILVFVFMVIGAGIKRWGKQRVFNVLMTGCGAFILISVLVPDPTMSIVMLIPGLCGIASNAVLAASVIQVFPTSLRALASCSLFTVGRLGAAVGSDLMAWGLQHRCHSVTIFIVAITGASGFLLYMWPDPEKVRAEMEAKDFDY